MSRTLPLIDHSRIRWLLAGAGAALLAAQAALPVTPGDAAQQVAAIGAHRGAVTASAAAFLLAGVLLIVSVAALNTLAVPRARRLTRVGVVLTGLGAAWPIAGRAAFNLVMVAITGSTDHASAVTATHAITTSAAFTPLLITLAAFVLGPIVLTIGLWRAETVPPWPALLWVVGVLVVNAAEAGSRPLTVAGMLAAAVALGWLGAATSNNSTAHSNVSAEHTGTATSATVSDRTRV
jgi:hypothetical protein